MTNGSSFCQVPAGKGGINLLRRQQPPAPFDPECFAAVFSAGNEWAPIKGFLSATKAKPSASCWASPTKMSLTDICWHAHGKDTYPEM